MFERIPEGWMALLLLGAFHGVNPGMGWLFAVALGLQERSGRAVWRALPPLLAGHALSVAVAMAAGALLGLAVGAGGVRIALAALLVLMGALHLRRAWHPRYGGMRVGARDLVIWSFLMASGHGAGLMALAFVPRGEPHAAVHEAAAPTYAALASPERRVEGASLPAPQHASGHAVHGAGRGSRDSGVVDGLLASLVHTLGYAVMTGLLAALVYYRLGLRLLQRGWLNLDAVWAGSLVLTGLLILLT